MVAEKSHPAIDKYPIATQGGPERTDHSTALKSMLQDIINDRSEQATITMHDYFVAKTREVAGLGGPPQVEPPADDNTTSDDD